MLVPAVAALALAPLLLATAPALACAVPEAVVRVAVVAPEPEIRRGLDVSALSGLARLGVAEGGAPRRVVGLTEVDFRFAVDRLEIGGRAGCRGVRRVAVTLAAYQTVHVARLRAGTGCHDRAILEHERLHVEINRGALTATADALRDDLRLPASTAWTADAARAELRAAVTDVIEAAGRAAFAAARAEHARIDAGEGFRAIRERCGGPPWPGAAQEP